MTDPLHLDADYIHALASEPIVRRGFVYFKEHRVTDIRFEPGRYVEAQVEGSNPDLLYAVRVDVDDDGELNVGCTCPFDWEPACKHVVATLLAYAVRQPVTDMEVSGAADEAALVARASVR